MNYTIENATAPPVVAKVNKPKVRLPFSMRLTRWLFPKLELVAPRYAHARFVKLFFTPLRYPLPEHEKEMIGKAERFTITLGTKHIDCYAWGNGPVILFVHGWSGRAPQFTNFIQHFIQQGYRAVAFDAPAHGLSAGKTTSVFDFKDAILALEKTIGENIKAVIGHSLGGIASAFALTEGLKVDTLITIATPTIGDDIINEFAIRLNASPRAARYLKDYIHRTFGRPFDELMASHFIKSLPAAIRMLVIHDEHDKEAPLRNAARLLEAYPRATYIKTEGLGHVRILRDNNVIAECLRFIEM
jgi:pimeloyl-ACP methyl ester carboxylesterase